VKPLIIIRLNYYLTSPFTKTFLDLSFAGKIVGEFMVCCERSLNETIVDCCLSSRTNRHRILSECSIGRSFHGGHSGEGSLRLYLPDQSNHRATSDFGSLFLIMVSS
jgi:hypothetical protein